MLTDSQHDPLLELEGSGKGLWGDGSVDEYVNLLRDECGMAGPHYRNNLST